MLTVYIYIYIYEHVIIRAIECGYMEDMAFLVYSPRTPLALVLHVRVLYSSLYLHDIVLT